MHDQDNHSRKYSYRDSIKSDRSDELINIYLIRPAAGVIVRLIFNSRITPNMITLLSILTGFIAGLLYFHGCETAFLGAGLCVTIKDILDSADGQLARARSQYSRAGRFLDSIGDFAVNLFIFSGIGFSLYRISGSPYFFLLAALGLAGITFRVSYHVFYHVKYLHSLNKYGNNRISETVLDEDLTGPGIVLILQRIFQVIYGWQDSMIAVLDRWSRKNNNDPDFLLKWYSDGTGLLLAGLTGLGTELFILTLFSLTNELEIYLYVNIVLMNVILIMNILYRRCRLNKKMAAL
jgi:phosphatidylglycerophosphate synthase